jgi:phosphopantetheine adenylyltransferase
MVLHEFFLLQFLKKKKKQKKRIVSEPQHWTLSAVSQCIAAAAPSTQSQSVGNWPQIPEGYLKTFPFSSAKISPRFDHTVNGGTFDRMHNGHRVLLGGSMAVSAKSLTVGITSDAMIAAGKKTLKEMVQPYPMRRAAVEQFLSRCNPDVIVKAPAIDDPFGPSIVDAQLQCIIVSEETKAGGLAVNEKRKEAGLTQLEVAVVNCWDRYQKEGSVETKISSTDARKREAAKKQKL